MRPIIILLIAGLALFSISCNDDSKEIQLPYELYVVLAKAGSDKESVFIGAGILSFNLITKEIIFTDAATEKLIYSFDAVKFYLNKAPLFESTVVSNISSVLINDLVLFYSIVESKYYLNDGYPEISDVWSNAAEIRKNREKNAKKREKNWNKFINYLSETGKIVK